MQRFGDIRKTPARASAQGPSRFGSSRSPSPVRVSTYDARLPTYDRDNIPREVHRVMDAVKEESLRVEARQQMSLMRVEEMNNMIANRPAVHVLKRYLSDDRGPGPELSSGARRDRVHVNSVPPLSRATTFHPSEPPILASYSGSKLALLPRSEKGYLGPQESEKSVKSTISRDNTAGEHARHTSLFAQYGKKISPRLGFDVGRPSLRPSRPNASSFKLRDRAVAEQIEMTRRLRSKYTEFTEFSSVDKGDLNVDDDDDEPYGRQSTEDRQPHDRQFSADTFEHESKIFQRGFSQRYPEVKIPTAYFF